MDVSFQKIPEIYMKKDVRKEASHSIKDEEEIAKDYQVLLQQIEKHDIIGLRITAREITIALQRGLREMSDVLTEELSMLKEKLEKDILFLRKNKPALTKEQLDIYNHEFLSETRTFLYNIRLRYVSDAANAIRYEEFGSYKSVELSSGKSFIERFFESKDMESLVREIQKLERKIIRLDELKGISKRKAEKLIKENRRYYDDFKRLLGKMLAFNIAIIVKAHNSAAAIEEAVKRFDLIPSYIGYAENIRLILQDNGAKQLREIEKRISGAERLINNAKKIIEKQNEA